MRKFLLVTAAAMILAIAANPAQAGIDEGEWEVAVSGEMFISEGHDNLGFQIQVGYFVTAEIEVGVWFGYHNQDLDIEQGSSSYADFTKTWWDVAGFVSWNFVTDGDWTPYVGLFIGSESGELDFPGSSSDADRGGFMWGGFIGVRFWVSDGCAFFIEYRLMLRTEDWDIDGSSVDGDDAGAAHRIALGFSVLMGGA